MKIKKKSNWAFRSMLLLLASLATPSFSQQKSIDYLGQKPPGLTPELFAPGLVSTKYYEHSAPTFSPDGKRVLWTVIYERGKPSQLMEMRQENGTWTKPSSPAFADLSADDFYPAFSANGRKLYFNSRRKVPAGFRNAGLRIWEVELSANGWAAPVPFDTVVSAGEDYCPSMANNGTMYFTARRQNGRVSDIVSASRQNNQYHAPETLPYNINTTGSEDGVFIAADDSYLIFESGRPGSIDGSTDLYISFRRRDGGWGPARNMGAGVNSKFTERFPKVSPDGKYLFFGSDRDLAPGAEGTDIYWVDARVISALKAQEGASEPAIDILGKEILTASYSSDFAKTANLLKEWMDLYPKDDDAFVSYIKALRRSNQISEAERMVKSRNGNLPANLEMKLELALIMYQSGKSVEAEDFILSHLPPLPQYRYRYTQLANQLYLMKKYAESARIYERALAIQQSGTDFYNMACSWSLSGNSDKAFEALNKAADNGFNSKADFEGDTDLVSLKSDARWESLLKKLK